MIAILMLSIFILLSYKMKMIWKNYSLNKVCVKLSVLDYYTTTVITYHTRIKTGLQEHCRMDMKGTNR